MVSHPKLKDNFILDTGDSGGFPDCFALRNGQRIGIEFELYASNFFDHKHDRNMNLPKCNLIICWENDLPQTIKRDGKEFVEVKGQSIEVFGLDKIAKSLGLMKKGERPGYIRRNEQGFFEQLNNYQPANIALVKQVYDKIKSHQDFAIKWGGGKKWNTVGFLVRNWNVSPIGFHASGYVEMVYRGNKSIFPWWELPTETRKELQQIFGKTKPWHKIPLDNETDLKNLYNAFDILAKHSKIYQVKWHVQS